MKGLNLKRFEVVKTYQFILIKYMSYYLNIKTTHRTKIQYFIIKQNTLWFGCYV